jgi:hypothetical protein
VWANDVSHPLNERWRRTTGDKCAVATGSGLLQGIFSIIGSWTSLRRPGKETKIMEARHRVAAGCAAAMVLLGVGGGIAVAQTGGPVPQSPAVNGPDVPGQPDVPEPGDTPDVQPQAMHNGPDLPGQPDLPEPGDTPDAPGQ